MRLWSIMTNRIHYWWVSILCWLGCWDQVLRYQAVKKTDDEPSEKWSDTVNWNSIANTVSPLEKNQQWFPFSPIINMQVIIATVILTFVFHLQESSCFSDDCGVLAWRVQRWNCYCARRLSWNEGYIFHCGWPPQESKYLCHFQLWIPTANVSWLRKGF